MDSSHRELLSEPGAPRGPSVSVALAVGLPGVLSALDAVTSENTQSIEMFLCATVAPPPDAHLLRLFVEADGILKDIPIGSLVKWLPLIRPFALPFGNLWPTGSTKR